MNNKEFIQIINEEITNFDFLNNDKMNKDDEIFQLVSEEAFQEQFIIDSIARMREKIKKSNEDVDGNEYSVDIEYQFNELEDPINLTVIIGDERADYNQLKDVPVKLRTFEGDIIDFNAFNNESDRVREMFVKSFLNGVRLDNNNDGDGGYNSPPVY